MIVGRVVTAAVPDLRALRQGPAPVEVATDKAGPYLRVIDELVPTAAHTMRSALSPRCWTGSR